MRTRSVLAALAASALLVTGFDAATYAATGQSLILGQVNKAGRPTTIQNTGNGPALELLTRETAPPLAVGSTRKVRRLNSDQLDGWDSSAMLNRATVLTDDDTTSAHGKTVEWSLSDISAGRYLVTWDTLIQADTAGALLSCGLVETDTYTHTWVSTVESALQAGMAVPLSSSAVVDFDPNAMHFMCATTEAHLRLAQPLTVAFQPLSLAEDRPLSELPG